MIELIKFVLRVSKNYEYVTTFFDGRMSLTERSVGLSDGCQCDDEFEKSTEQYLN